MQQKQMEPERIYYDANNIQDLLGVSRGKAYSLIHDLNIELADRGYIVIPGKIPRKYFAEKYYGMTV